MENTKKLKITAVISGVLTAAICAVMNFIFIPVIEKGAATRCFDMTLGYSFTDALRFLSTISAEGKAIYLSRQLPLDFVYPIAYCVFFCVLIYLLMESKSLLFIFPVMLAIFDYIENVCVVIMLKSEVPSIVFVSFASSATMMKSMLMYVCFLLIAVLIILRIVANTKKKRKAE